jgi:4-amino-4-deoxy-L-arabinose transferase-like glycosyltransferase
MINLTFTAWPEMLAWPYLILQGWLPYRDIAIAHNPLLLLDLVIFFKLFGVGIMQLKIFTWILISTNVYLTYYVGKKFWSKNIGLLSSFLYLILCIIFEGNGLWFDLALPPFALLLYLFLKEKKYVWAGVFFVLGFLTKQTFIYFAVPTVFYILQSTLIKKNIANFNIGSGIVISIFIVILSLLGILDDYYNWAIKFGILYLPTAVGQISFPTLKQLLFAVAPFLIVVFGANYLVLSFMVVGVLGVYPRWELFHFQPALPFLSIVIASFVYSKRNIFLKSLIIVCSMLYIVYGIGRQFGGNTRFFESDVQKVQDSVITNQYSNIYVVNYWDNIYALTNTLPPKPLIPYIPWYLDYGESKNIILSNLKSEMPDSVVIGQRGNEFPELYEFVNKYYECNIIDKTIEMCKKN